MSDVRMKGFARRSTVAQALAWLDSHLRPLPEENVPLAQAAGRVLSRPIVSDVNVPGFARAMMDGYAIRASDVQGAGPYSRLTLRVIGCCMPGRPFAGTVQSGTAVRIMTGAPLPAGADAVLPAELTEGSGEQVQAVGDVGPGKHVGNIGEDIVAGQQVLPAGRMLRPQDVGVLSSIGVAEVPVVRCARVRIVITGNELLPAGARPEGYRIVDANGPMLQALVARDGGVPELIGPLPDQPEIILDAMRGPADVVLVSGGSSVGEEDCAPLLVRQHGQLAIHGIAMRPSSPTGMGLLDGRLVLLLPGNPVSCLCAYDFFAGRAIRGLGGRNTDWPYRRVRLPLARKIVSAIGSTDYLRVRLVDGCVQPLAVSGASILSSTTRADGFVIVPDDCEGFPPGAEVEVFLYDDLQAGRL
jgi:molybdopterin molybdotransferase